MDGKQYKAIVTVKRDGNVIDTIRFVDVPSDNYLSILEAFLNNRLGNVQVEMSLVQ